MLSRFVKLEIKKVLTYLAVGGTAFLLYFSILWILFDLLTIHYPVAVTLSYLLASAFHFLSHRSFTFKIKNEKYKRQLFYYLLVAVLNYFIQLYTIKFLYEYSNINFYISAFLGMLVSIIVGFVLLNSWVFKEEE